MAGDINHLRRAGPAQQFEHFERTSFPWWIYQGGRLGGFESSDHFGQQYLGLASKEFAICPLPDDGIFAGGFDGEAVVLDSGEGLYKVRQLNGEEAYSTINVQEVIIGALPQ